MRSHKATEPEKVQEEELEQKLNSIGHCIEPEQVHLRKIYPKIGFSQDHAMQEALVNDDVSPIESSDT